MARQRHNSKYKGDRRGLCSPSQARGRAKSKSRRSRDYSSEEEELSPLSHEEFDSDSRDDDFDSRVQQIESPKRPTKKSKESTRRVSYSDSENYPPEDPQDMVETRKEKYNNMPKESGKKRSARDDEILELKRRLKEKDEQLAQVSAVTTSRKKGPSEKDPMVKMIAQVVRKKVWRKWRFILSPGQEQQVGHLVMDQLGEEYDPTTPEGKANRKSWLEMYSEVVTKKVNSVRNYYASQLRKQCAMKWMKKHGKDALIPTESFMKFLRREDPADAEEMSHFVFIWDKCLDIVNGGKYWKPPVRHFQTISEAKFEEDGKEKLNVPASTEAIMVTLWDNMHDRVQWQYEQKGDDEDVELDLKSPHQEGKYTDSKAGQDPYGGWKEDGLLFYKDCVEAAKTGRKSPGCAAWEAKILAEVRKVNGVTANDPSELCGNKKKKSKKAPINEGAIIDMFCDDDE